MSIDTKPITIPEFESFLELPENATGRFELINGEIIEVPSNPYVSYLAGLFLTLINVYLMARDKQGYVTGEGGGYVIAGHVFAPDVAYTEKIPTSHGFENSPPALAVEVISDPNSSKEQAELRRKTTIYIRAGVTVWVADYINQTIQVHYPDGKVNQLNIDDTLTDDEILPGFSVPLKDIFNRVQDSE